MSDFGYPFYSFVGPLVLLLPKRNIIWLSHLPILSVPDEGYFRNAPCALNLIPMFLLLHSERA